MVLWTPDAKPPRRGWALALMGRVERRRRRKRVRSERAIVAFAGDMVAGAGIS